MTHALLVPVYRGVLYSHIERGVHWSEIEHLVLWCLAQGPLGIKMLAAHCGLPEGVIVEAIVRLMRIGWVELVELEDRTAFEATPAGCVEAEKDRLKPIVRTTARNLHFIFDRVTGSVLGTDGLSLVRGARCDEWQLVGGCGANCASRRCRVAELYPADRQIRGASQCALSR